MKRAMQVLALAGAAWASAPTTAAACGGCFAPPGAVQVVTDHRMVLSLSATRTILWDQFRFSGRPAEFSWILPIRNGPDVRIEVADNNFLQALDNVSAPVLNPPPRPQPPYCGGEDDRAYGASVSDAASFADASAPSVTVLQEAVVGPYMTVVVRGDDPMALRTWLRDNGYNVPVQLEPVLDHYVALNMDFIALKLRPDQGVDRMSPIRITVPGLAPTLPLRMIAAGVADKVGLELLVLAQGRYEAQNFPNAQVTSSNLTYDFNAPTTPSADFLNAEARLSVASGNRAWITESTQTVYEGQIASATQGLGFRGGPRPTGMVTDDAQVAFAGIGDQATLTRLRAELGPSALDRDLQLAASASNAEVNRIYSYGTVLNTPPPYPTCEQMRALGITSPTGFARAGGISCAVRPWHTAGGHGVMVLFGLAALTAIARRRGR